MRISLEKGEVLEVAIVEGDRVVGSLSLTLRDMVASAPKAAAQAAMAAAPVPRKRRTGKRYVSPEARARMAEAQKRRWEAYRASKAAPQE